MRPILVIIVFICGVFFAGILSNKEKEQLPLNVVQQNDVIKSEVVKEIAKIRDSLNVATAKKDPIVNKNVDDLVPEIARVKKLADKVPSLEKKLKETEKELAYWKRQALSNKASRATVNIETNDYEGSITPTPEIKEVKKQRKKHGFSKFINVIFGKQKK